VNEALMIIGFGIGWYLDGIFLAMVDMEGVDYGS